jgi:hypothetical protein
MAGFPRGIRLSPDPRMDGSCDTAEIPSLLLLKRSRRETILRGPEPTFPAHDYCAERVDARAAFAYYPPRLSRCEASLFGTSRSGLRFKQGSFYERIDISGVHEAVIASSADCSGRTAKKWFAPEFAYGNGA